jgi:hypothetical protein
MLSLAPLAARAAGLTDCDGRPLPEDSKVSEEDVLVCTITINSSNERDTFRRRTCGEKKGGKHYKFLELTQLGSGEDWFDDACAAIEKQKALRSRGCEVLLVSGHFAGKYFFGSTDKQLTMSALEAASCSNKCGGVLRDPTEVFLFGCNTLAGKSSSADNPDAMRARLRADHLPEGDIEQIVQGRFGDLGDSNLDRMRRVFSGVPNVYGYRDIGPLGAAVQSAFDSYLQKAEQGGKTYRDWLTERQLKPVTNVALLSSLKAFPITMTCGTPAAGDSPEATARRIMCALKDDSGNSIAARLGLLRTILKSDADFMRYQPVMQKFFEDHPPPYHEVADQQAYAQLLESVKGMGPAVVARINSDGLKGYPLLRYDLSSVSYALGWGPLMKQKSLTEYQEATVRELLRKGPLSSAASKLICHTMMGYENTRQLDDDGASFDWKDLGIQASDVDPKILSDASGIWALGCLRPTDPAIQLQLAKQMDQLDPPSEISRTLAALGLDGRHFASDATGKAFKRLLSVKPQPALDPQVLGELARQLKTADAHERDTIFEVLRMIKPAPSDPALVKAVCAVQGAKGALAFCQ